MERTLLNREVFCHWDCQNLLIENFRKGIKSDGEVGISGIGNILKSTLAAASADSFSGTFEWEGAQTMSLNLKRFFRKCKKSDRMW